MIGAIKVAAALCLIGVGAEYWYSQNAAIPPSGIVGYETLSERLGPELPREPGESIVAYASRASAFVHLNSYHCSPSESVRGWLTNAVNMASAGTLFDEGVLVYERLFCGFCHQRAYALKWLLDKAGIVSHVFGINGHVVLKFQTEEGEYIADPDYGVAPFPYSGEASSLMDLVVDRYSPIPWGSAQWMVGAFLSKSDNAEYTENHLETREQRQRLVYATLDIGAVALLISGFALLFRSAPKTRRPQLTSGIFLKRYRRKSASIFASRRWK